MAYTLRDIIKQRTGEVAATQIHPTIFKFNEEDEWLFSTKIKKIGESPTEDCVSRDDVLKMSKQEVANITELPTFVFIKQIGTECERVNSICIDYKELKNGEPLPVNLFKYAINVTDLTNALYNQFSYREDVKEIPEDLLKNCTKLRNVTNMFYGSYIKSIPENLFANCPDIESFEYTFAESKGLKYIPENLFANNKKLKISKVLLKIV